MLLLFLFSQLSHLLFFFWPAASPLFSLSRFSACAALLATTIELADCCPESDACTKWLLYWLVNACLSAAARFAPGPDAEWAACGATAEAAAAVSLNPKPGRSLGLKFKFFLDDLPCQTPPPTPPPPPLTGPPPPAPPPLENPECFARWLLNQGTFFLKIIMH